MTVQDNYSDTAIIFASIAGHTDIVSLLLKSCADVTVQNMDVKTAAYSTDNKETKFREQQRNLD